MDSLSVSCCGCDTKACVLFLVEYQFYDIVYLLTGLGQCHQYAAFLLLKGQRSLADKLHDFFHLCGQREIERVVLPVQDVDKQAVALAGGYAP